MGIFEVCIFGLVCEGDGGAASAVRAFGRGALRRVDRRRWSPRRLLGIFKIFDHSFKRFWALETRFFFFKCVIGEPRVTCAFLREGTVQSFIFETRGNVPET